MSPDTAWMIFKAILVLGFAVWTAIAALNNIVDFRGASAAIGSTMAMMPLNDPPAIPSPLTKRALISPRVKGAALLGVLIVQIAAAVALGIGGVILVASGLGAGSAAVGVTAALTGFTLLAGLWLLMMIGGLWFGYWIRQERLQLTHIALLAVTMIAAAVTHG